MGTIPKILLLASTLFSLAHFASVLPTTNQELQKEAMTTSVSLESVLAQEKA